MRKLIPLDLGGSPSRCAVAPPPRGAMSPDAVEAMILHYRQRFGARDFEAAFFHGGVPGPQLLEAAHGLPKRLSVHPSDLAVEDARLLLAAQTEIIELEVLTFEPHVLRTCRRSYTTGRALEMISALKKMGFRVGVHLVPGLPGSGHEPNDADLMTAKNAGADFLRVWPAIALDGADLAEWAKNGTWEPWSLEQAVDAVSGLLTEAERAEVPVIRVGIQPGQDIPVKATAGPVHPNLRGLVEASRFGTKMDAAIPKEFTGRDVTFLVHPKDISLAKGASNSNAHWIRRHRGLRTVVVQPDETVERGTVVLDGGAA